MTTVKSKLAELRRKVSCEAGTVTLEFVLLFPLLVAWFLGSFIYFDAYRSNALTAKVSFTVSDLIARSASLTEARLGEFYDIQKRMLPSRIEQSWMRVSSICYLEREVAGGETEGEYRLHWSTTFDSFYDEDAGEEPNILKFTKDEEIPVELMPLMADGDTVIFTEVFGVWTPIAEQWSGYVGLREMTWANRLVERPRFTNIITHATENDSISCPTPTWEGI